MPVTNTSSAPKGKNSYFVRHIQWKYTDPKGDYIQSEKNEIVAWLDTKNEAETEIARLGTLFPATYQVLNLLTGQYDVWVNFFTMDRLTKAADTCQKAVVG